MTRTIAESEAEAAMRRMLSNFGYGITPRTVAVFMCVLAEYVAKVDDVCRCDTMLDRDCDACWRARQKVSK